MTLFQSSAEVTAWPERIALTLLFFMIVGLIYFAMYKNWQGKAKRDSSVATPHRIERRTPRVTYQGTYVATTYSEDWLKRVHAHGLSLPSRASLMYFDDGIGIDLVNTDVFIPFESIKSVGSTHALAGKVYEAEGIVTVIWQLGDVEVVTGFRASTAADQVAILERGASVG